MPGPKYGEHTFPREFGFTGSADRKEGRTAVRSHTRAAPQRYAKGGQVKQPPQPFTGGRRVTGASTIDRAVATNQADAETGGRTPLRPGFQKGGAVAKGSAGVNDTKFSRKSRKTEDTGVKKGAPMPFKKKAIGGPVKYAEGGDVAQDRRLVAGAIAKHVRAPKPRGHGVK